MVKVEAVEEMGAYVSLLEYNNAEGLMLQMSKRRRRRQLRVNKTRVCRVLRVDTIKGYIDLSDKNVTKEDKKACSHNYKKSKTVHRILKEISNTTFTDIEQLYENIAWPLYEQYGYNAFD